MRRSQTSFEYLMTYGMMGVIVAIVIVVLFYMGFFGGAPTVSQTISGFKGLEVTSAAANSTAIEFLIANDVGLPANITNLTLNYNGHVYNSYYCTNPYLSTGETTYCIVTGNFQSSLIITQVIINYTVSATLSLAADSVGTVTLTPTSVSLPYQFTQNSVGVTLLSPLTTPAPFQQLVVFDAQTYAGYEQSNLGNIRFYSAPMPSGVINYTTINISNTQSSATGSNFQQLLNISSSVWKGWANTSGTHSFQNVLFFNTSNGKRIISWLENYTKNYAIYWINIPGGIAADSKVTDIGIGFGANATNFFDGVNTGEAPQLSSTYAKYDNGADVFLLYDDFAQSQLNLSKWTWYNGTAGGGTRSTGSGIVITTVNVGGAVGAYILSKASFPATTVVDTYLKSSTNQGGLMEYSSSANFNVLGVQFPGNSSYAEGDVPGSLAGGYCNVSNWGTVSLGKPASLYWTSNGATFYVSSNYGAYRPFSATLGCSGTGSTGNVNVGIGFFPYVPNAVATWYWVDARNNAPNGVMPTVAINSLKQAELYSWCESGCTSSSNKSVFWVKLNAELPANKPVNVSMVFTPPPTNYDAVFAGEAPQLSSTYGKYDDGANVFNYYSSSNGATIPAPAAPIIAEMDTIMYPNASGIEQDVDLHNVSDWVYRASLRAPASCGSNYCFFTYDYNNNVFANGNMINSNISYGVPTVLSLYANAYSPTGVSSSINYGVQSTLSKGYSFTPTSLGFSGSQSGETKTYWERTRAYPPDGVMPIANVGHIYSVPITITNSQSSATAAPFQQNITVNTLRYSKYEAPNLQNVAFTYLNGTLIHSWLESGNLAMFSGNSNILIYNMTTSKDITIEAWFKTANTSNPSSGGSIFAIRTPNSNTVTLGISNGKICGRNENSTISVCGTTLVNDMNWHQAVEVVGADGMAIYVDGVLQAYSTSGYTTLGLSQDVMIGAGVNFGYAQYNGTIADVQLYNGSLTPFEIRTLYSEGQGGSPIKTSTSANVVGWWPLDGNGRDASGNGNNQKSSSAISYLGVGSASNSTLYWINLGGGIGARSAVQVRMNFYPAFENVLNNISSGEAPQLSPTYGQYDDGANVFNFYDNFAGTNLNTNKWTSLASVYTINNGLQITATPSTTNNNFLESVASYSVPLLVEIYRYTTTSNWFGFSFPNTYTTGGVLFYDQNGWSTYQGSSQLSGGSESLNTGYVQTGILAPSGQAIEDVNYANVITSGTSYYSGTSGNIYVGDNGGRGTIQWLRTRAYPPNGVMPSVSFGVLS